MGSLRSDRPLAAPKAPLGFCRTSRLVSAEKIGRRERIRTSGPYVPNVVLYQAELLSEPVRVVCPFASGGALITMAPCPRNRTASLSGRGLFSRFADWPGSLYTKAPVQGAEPDGASPSGKAPDFDSGMRRFDPSRPSHFFSARLRAEKKCPRRDRPSGRSREGDPSMSGSPAPSRETLFRIARYAHRCVRAACPHLSS